MIATKLGFCKMYSIFLRSTIAKFPALMSCCTINWFHEWPDDALNFVSNRFLGKSQHLHCYYFALPSLKSISFYPKRTIVSTATKYLTL